MPLLSKFKCIFWDFDGVIKESVEVKAQAYEQLFRSHGEDIAVRVRSHHEAHAGVSRFEKVPRYLEWAGERPTTERIQEYCRRFSQLAKQGVIDAPWVPGVEDLLRKNPYNQVFVLVTATPQEEIQEILVALNISSCFSEVYGAPLSKQDAIRVTLDRNQFDPNGCLVIGDARADWEASQANQVSFLLRRHETNRIVFNDYLGESVTDFIDR
jgi:phosphoglycolate phosphatase-like HAD superfamily hydrolase